MKDSVFRFKRFSVRNERSGLKVGTDGVLLGAACPLPPYVSHDSATDAALGNHSRSTRILDVGTGTGLIALMLAQRITQKGTGDVMPALPANGAADSVCRDAGLSETDFPGTGFPKIKTTGFEITGIEIDKDAAGEAAQNFAGSPWADSLKAVNVALQDFDGAGGGWDLIVSNPPFFENSLRAPVQARSNARHTDTLSYRDIIAFASRNLNEDGMAAMILPASEEIPLLRYAASFGLRPAYILSIRTTAAKAPKRIVVVLGRSLPAQLSGSIPVAEKGQRPRPLLKREELVMMEEGKYTPAFRALTEDFYLNV